jgi:hypothetical protein
MQTNHKLKSSDIIKDLYTFISVHNGIKDSIMKQKHFENRTCKKVNLSSGMLQEPIKILLARADGINELKDGSFIFISFILVV